MAKKNIHKRLRSTAFHIAQGLYDAGAIDGKTLQHYRDLLCASHKKTDKPQEVKDSK